MTATEENRSSRPAARNRAGAGAAAKAAQVARTERPRILLAALAGGVAGGLLGALLGHLGMALVLMLAGVVGAALWQRGRGDAARWRMGASGERRTGRLLARLERRGWTVLHDRQLAPRSRANIDHLLVSPDGIIYNVDSKMRTGSVRYNARRNYLRIGRSSGYQLVSSTLYETERIAQALMREVGPVTMRSVLAVHRAKLPAWHVIEIKGVQVLGARRVRGWLAAQAGQPTARGREIAAACERVFPAYIQR
ncbi:nuclease-related domain-containing protein [Nocardiopsis dassonvillei]|uniref:nuclease-related domain-containing protein n=1 Tax=Nocardiopsis dassonvillei TaxID=2014 RepID=UPI00366CFF23